MPHERHGSFTICPTNTVMVSTDESQCLALNPVLPVSCPHSYVSYRQPGCGSIPRSCRTGKTELIWFELWCRTFDKHPRPPPPYGLNSSLNLFPINVSWIFRSATCGAGAGKQKAFESSLWWRVMIVFSFYLFLFIWCCRLILRLRWLRMRPETCSKS